MVCPFCTASLPDDDFFCEACGKPLNRPVASASAPRTGPAQGCSCGAPPEDIDEEGYCERCGLLTRRPPSDHIELVLSAECAGVSDRGHKHQRNEDRFAIRQVGDSYVLVVCDGVSSSTQSELASSAVAERVADSLEASLRRHSASSPERTVRSAIYDAQARLAAMNAEGHSADPPSTTIVAALVKGKEETGSANIDATIGWAGDSRAYWIGQQGEAHPLTSDHSWLNDVVASGEMTLEEASKAPQAHGITRWLGSDAGDAAVPDVTQFRIPGPGQLLLCTDGFWNYAESSGQISSLVQGEQAIDVTRSLIDYANDHGGHDNITAILLRFAATAPAPEPISAAESPAACESSATCESSETAAVSEPDAIPGLAAPVAILESFDQADSEPPPSPTAADCENRVATESPGSAATGCNGQGGPAPADQPEPSVPAASE